MPIHAKRGLSQTPYLPSDKNNMSQVECKDVRMCVCIGACTCACMYTQVCMQVGIRVCTDVYVYVCMCVREHMYLSTVLCMSICLSPCERQVKGIGGTEEEDGNTATAVHPLRG